MIRRVEHSGMYNTSKGLVATNKNRGGEGLHHQRALHSARPHGVNFSKLAADLAKAGKNFYSRGWVLGTSGNFSAVTSLESICVRLEHI
jgi:hypothetical protein